MTGHPAQRALTQNDVWELGSQGIAASESQPQVLNLCSGNEYVHGWINAGPARTDGGPRDIVFDALSAAEMVLPLADDSLDGIHIAGLFDCVRDGHALMNELWRVAKPGASLHLRVAHAAGPLAWRHPAQVRAVHEGSLAFFAQPSLGEGALSGYVADWAVERLRIVIDPPCGEVPRELVATLTAVKPARARGTLWPSKPVQVERLVDERVDPAFMMVDSGAPAFAGLATACVPLRSPRTLFLVHEQRFLYFQETSYAELYLPMKASGRLGETMVHPYQRDLRFASMQPGAENGGAHLLLEQLLDQKMQEFGPELVVNALTWPQESVPPAVLARLKKRHGFRLASIIWDYDESNPLLQELDRGVIAVSDATLVADSALRAERIRRREGLYREFTNTEGVFFMSMVPPTALFHPRAERLYDVTVSGSNEGFRGEVIRHLRAAGFALHRSGGMMEGDCMLPIEQYAAELAASRIVVNSQTQSSRVQVKGRVGQCLASGTLLLEQDNPESRRYLEGIEVDYWKNFEDLDALLRRHLAEPQAREAQARRAHEAWKKRYNAQGFTDRLLTAVSARQADMPAAA